MQDDLEKLGWTIKRSAKKMRDGQHLRSEMREDQRNLKKYREESSGMGEKSR